MHIQTHTSMLIVTKSLEIKTHKDMLTFLYSCIHTSYIYIHHIYTYKKFKETHIYTDRYIKKLTYNKPGL